MQGGYTSLCIKIYKLFIEQGGKYQRNTPNQKKQIKEWIKNNLEFKFYPLDDPIAIGIVETALITQIKPPLNNHDNKKKN